jgi:hypothetical protein
MKKIIDSMGNLCQFGCGCVLEYESHEFSDGFVYKIPRNSDNTLHECLIPKIISDVFFDDVEIYDYSLLHESKKNNLYISVEEFTQLIEEGVKNPTLYVGVSEKWEIMGMLRHGKMDELIQDWQDVITKRTLPFHKNREFLPSQNAPIQSEHDGVKISLGPKIKFKENESSIYPDELCNTIPVILPTDKGYQLEYLGYYYELMTKFQDAKKCYDLQYQFTEEPELSEKSLELAKKIKRQNQIQKDIPTLTVEKVRNEIKITELNLRRYVHELFANDLDELFKKFPSLRDDVQRIRKKRRDSMLEVEEKSDIDNLSLGTIIHILKICKTRDTARKNGGCTRCGKSWIKGKEIFYKNKIKCVDEVCFKKQGGLIKDIPSSLIVRGELVTDFRNNIDHIIQSTSQRKLQLNVEETYRICQNMNHHIEDFIERRKLI